jgi:hypothetical protein
VAESATAWGKGAFALGRLGLCLVLFFALLLAAPALANDKAKLIATSEQGYARIVIDFPNRQDLPRYHIRSTNGVLAVQFDQPVDLSLPDIASALPEYVTVARQDSDGKGIRFGLTTPFTVDHIEGGEQLFIDLLPTSWQGLPPGLPPEVVAKLAERARQAAIKAEQARKAAAVKAVHPAAQVRVGRNPTFMRVEFTWNVDTKADFALAEKSGNLDFEWPVPIDLSLLKVNLPQEVAGVDNAVTPDGSRVVFRLGGKVVPRFYAISPRDFIVDIDTASLVPPNPDPAAAATAKALGSAMASGSGMDGWWLPALRSVVPQWAAPAVAALSAAPQPPITPEVTTVGSTVRITFPFDRDTPAAVFRRGDTVWLLFDTMTGINEPPFTGALASLATGFSVVPTGDLQVVRLDLSADRLATLGSQGRSWVLSLGDALLSATEPLGLNRRIDPRGLDEVTADLARPARVHQFLDPIVGDKLYVVTAFPPARGLAHDVGYVDFEALRSAQGLVVRPTHNDVEVRLDGKLAVIASPSGLTISHADAVAVTNTLAAANAPRTGFLDLAGLKEDNPVAFNARVIELSAAAARSENQAREAARLDLARFYVANRYALEAIGVIEVLQAGLKTDALRNEAQMLLAAADVLAARPADALSILNAPAFTNGIDARMWRSMAEADAEKYAEARRDALASAPIIGGYPAWLRTRFLLSATRSALETGDLQDAERLHKEIVFADLEPEEITDYQLLAGRIAEAEGRYDEALDVYGQVIAADFRPTRAEAVFRTISVLNQTKRIDLGKAINTLAAESLLWRGDALEARMDKLLAELYFRHGDYRLGLQTAKQAVASFPSSPAMDDLGQLAQDQFQDLFLNGKADKLQPVEALSIFYDYSALTPPGSRGDQMIRNLAQRLVKVDLLGQAADLLKYQIDNRLKGAAQAQVAVELAVIEIANRNPKAALQVLTATQLADLPPSLDRQRRILEARALIDAKRTQLALDILTPVKGRDADRLRVEANWNAKNYEAVASTVEEMYAGDLGSGGPGLGKSARMDVLRAGVALALANDPLALSRLRSKFSDAMSGGPEWPMFDFLTSAVQPLGSPQFAAVAAAVADLDTLDAFLKSYKQVYGGESPMVPDAPALANGAAAQSASAAATPPAAAG